MDDSTSMAGRLGAGRRGVGCQAPGCVGAGVPLAGTRRRARIMCRALGRVGQGGGRKKRSRESGVEKVRESAVWVQWHILATS